MDRILSPLKNDINMYTNSLFLHREHVIGNTGPQAPALSLADPYLTIRKLHDGYTGPEIIHNILDGGYTGHTGLQGETGPTGAIGPTGEAGENPQPIGFNLYVNTQGITGGGFPSIHDITSFNSANPTRYGTYNTSNMIHLGTGVITLPFVGLYHVCLNLTINLAVTPTGENPFFSVKLMNSDKTKEYLRSTIPVTAVTPTVNNIQLNGTIYVTTTAETLNICFQYKNVSSSSTITGSSTDPLSTFSFQYLGNF